MHSAAVQIHARSTGAQQETLDEWLVSLGTSPPAPPPPPPPFITLSLADLDCRNAYVHGLRSFVSRGSGQSAVFEEERPPSFTLAFDDGGIHCTLGRLEVHDGPLPDGREPSLLLHMTEGTVGMLSQLSMLSPISSLDISASGISGEFAFSLNPRGASGLPAGIRMPVSVVSIPPGGLAVTLTTGNEWADAIMKGAVTLIETLVSQIIASTLTNELTQIVELDCSPVLATLEADLHSLEERRPSALPERPDLERHFSWRAPTPEEADELPFSALSWLNTTLSNGRVNAAFASRFARAAIVLNADGEPAEKGSKAFVLEVPLPDASVEGTTTVAAAASGASGDSTVAAAAAAAVVAATGTDSLPFPPPLEVSIPLGRLGTAEIRLTALSFEGFDTITLASLSLVDLHSVRAAIQGGDLKARATVRLIVTPLTPEEDATLVAREVIEEEMARKAAAAARANADVAVDTILGEPPPMADVPPPSVSPADAPAPPPADSCNCSWTSDLACPASLLPGATGWATDDGSYCYQVCCAIGLFEEVEVELSLLNASAEALLSIGVDTAVASRTPIAVLLENAQCARDVLGLRARHLSLRLTPGDLSFKPIRSDARSAPSAVSGALLDQGDGVLETAFGKVISDVVRLVVASASDDAISTLIDATVGGPVLHRLNRLLAAPRGDDLHDVIAARCGTPPPESRVGPSLDRPPGNAVITTRLDKLIRDPSTNGTYAKPQWCDTPVETLGTQMDVDKSALHAAMRVNELLAALGLHSLDIPGDALSFRLNAPFADPVPVGVTLSDISVRGLDGFNRILVRSQTCRGGSEHEPDVGFESRVASPLTGGAAGQHPTPASESVLTGSSMSCATYPRPSMSISSSLSVRMLGHTHTWTANLSVSEFEIAEVHEILLARERFRYVTLADLTTPCVVSPLLGLRVDLLAAAVRTFELSLTSSSDGFSRGVDRADPTSLQRRQARLSADRIESFLASIHQDVLGALNDFFASSLKRAHEACEQGEPYSSPDEDPEDLQQLSALVLFAIYGFALLLIALVVGGHFYARSIRLVSTEAWLAPEAAAAPSLAAYFSPSLVNSVSVLLVLNITVFLIANAFPGAVVGATVALAGDALPLMHVFKFALAESVIRFWRTGGQGYTLSILIAFYSGVWPYVKLTLTIFCLWAPPDLLPERVRGRLLAVFEALGKWSLIDSLMVFILMAAMKIDFDLASDGGGPSQASGVRRHDEPPPLLQVSAEVMPTAGITLFTLGVVISLVLTAVVGHMHRTLVLTPHEVSPGSEITGPARNRSYSAVRFDAVGSAEPTVYVHAVDNKSPTAERAGHAHEWGHDHVKHTDGNAKGAREAESPSLRRRLFPPEAQDSSAVENCSQSTPPRRRRLSLLRSPAALSEPIEPSPKSGLVADTILHANLDAAEPTSLRCSLRAHRASATARASLPSSSALDIHGEASPCRDWLLAGAVTLALSLAVGLSTYSWFIPIFSLSKEGLLGVVVGVERSHDDYSVVDGAKFLLLASPSSPMWVMRALQALYVVVLMVSPVLWYGLSLWMWLVPTRAWIRHHMGLVLHLLYSFSAVEVYLVCMVLSLLQLDQVSQQFTGELSHGGCAAAEPMLEAHFREQLQATPTCLTLSSRLQSAYWILLAATFFGLAGGLFINSMLDQEHARIKDELAAAAERQAVARDLASVFGSLRERRRERGLDGRQSGTKALVNGCDEVGLAAEATPYWGSTVRGLASRGVRIAKWTFGYGESSDESSARQLARGFSQEML